MELILKIMIYLILGVTIINTSLIYNKAWQADRKNTRVSTMLLAIYAIGVASIVILTKIIF